MGAKAAGGWGGRRPCRRRGGGERRGEVGTGTGGGLSRDGVRVGVWRNGGAWPNVAAGIAWPRVARGRRVAGRRWRVTAGGAWPPVSRGRGCHVAAGVTWPPVSRGRRGRCRWQSIGPHARRPRPTKGCAAAARRAPPSTRTAAPVALPALAYLCWPGPAWTVQGPRFFGNAARESRMWLEWRAGKMENREAGAALAKESRDAGLVVDGFFAVVLLRFKRQEKNGRSPFLLDLV